METSNLSEIRLDEETLPELRSLTHALNEMLERLSRGFDAQRQFVGNAAHELRTPLTLLQTQLELFPDEHPDIPPESAAFLAALQDEVQRLSRLTHALLDMSDLQSVPRNDVILLSPMIDEVFADLAPLAERNGISLSREGENITVVGSDMLLCRMFSNLVENAVKYNHPGGMVKVDVQQRDRQAVIHVADTGRGIPQEFWQSIFQPFFRVDKSLSRELGGAGLGLPLVWEIARLHGGRVWVEESNDSGSVLAVTLQVVVFLLFEVTLVVHLITVKPSEVLERRSKASAKAQHKEIGVRLERQSAKYHRRWASSLMSQQVLNMPRLWSGLWKTVPTQERAVESSLPMPPA